MVNLWARTFSDTKKISLDDSKKWTVDEAITASAKALGVEKDAGPWLCSQFLQDVIKLSGKDASVNSSDTLETVGIKEDATLYVALSSLQGSLALAESAATPLLAPSVEAKGPSSSPSPPEPQAVAISPKDYVKTLNENNIVDELKKAKGPLRDAALEYFDKNCSKILETKSALGKLDNALLMELLKRDTLGIKEADLFVWVLSWAQGKVKADTPEQLNVAQGKVKADTPEQLKACLKDILPLIRFPTMASKDIAHKVLPSQILKVSQTVELFTYIGATEAGVSAQLGSNIKEWSTVKRKPPVSMLVFDMTVNTPLTISEGGLVCEHTGSNGAAYCLNAITEGKWKWTVDVLSAKGNCMTIGVATKKDARGSGRSTGLHASGNCLDLQLGCGKSGKSFRVKRLTDGTKVTVLLDMTTREMGFEVAGEKSGMVVKGLPDTVYPAIDMREKGLKVKLGEIEPMMD
eukprot:g2301.t1